MKDTELIKQKIDVVDLVGEYVQLKASGINHKGLCPFHQEKSPSFMVNRERQSWHCFGCNKGGDVFSFVQEIEGMDFVEALKMLANKAGVQLTNTVEDKAKSSQKQRIKDINAKAAAFYHHILTNIDGAKLAREYLTGRALTDETIREWQIGFVPEQWDLLTQYMLKKGHSIDDLVAAGLTIKREGADARSGKGFYDRFRGRIMFPIWDVHGNVVGFTGRVLVETEKSGGKYVNTPQTPVYDKSSVVFGLNKAKQEIRKKDMAVLVEGQMDVIACHQAGMANVVATSGTALTDEQIRLLKRYSSNVNMAFDADEAGVKAAKRGIDIAVEEGMHVKVIEIPEGKGKDPDECIKQSKDVWFDAVLHARPVMEWYVGRTFAGKNMSDPQHKQQVVDILLPEVSRIPYAVERDHWLQELAGRVGVDVTVLRDDAKRLGEQQKKIVPTRVVGDAGTSLTPKEELSRAEQLFERLILGALVLKDGSHLMFTDDSLLGELRTTAQYPLYEMLKMQYTQDRSLDIDAIRQNVEEKNGEQPLDILLMKASHLFGDYSLEMLATEIAGTKKALVDTLKQGILRSLETALRQAEAAKDTEQMKAILAKVQALHTMS